MIESLKTFIRFPFRGPNWTSRFIVGSALVLGNFMIPIIPSFFVLGYVLEIMRRVIKGEEPSLPAWDNPGKILIDGVKGFVAALVYLLPGLVLIVSGYIFYFLTFLLLPGNDPTVILAWFLFLASLFLGIVLLTLGSIPLPAAIANLAAKGKIGAAFEISEWWAIIKANPWGYLGAWAVSAGMGYIGSWLSALPYYTIILCCFVPLIWAPVSFYILVIAGAVFAQFYRESSFSTSVME